jgi:hypothetical protein
MLTLGARPDNAAEDEGASATLPAGSGDRFDGT